MSAGLFTDLEAEKQRIRDTAKKQSKSHKRIGWKPGDITWLPSSSGSDQPYGNRRVIRDHNTRRGVPESNSVTGPGDDHG